MVDYMDICQQVRYWPLIGQHNVYWSLIGWLHAVRDQEEADPPGCPLQSPSGGGDCLPGSLEIYFRYLCTKVHILSPRSGDIPCWTRLVLPWDTASSLLWSWNISWTTCSRASPGSTPSWSPGPRCTTRWVSLPHMFNIRRFWPLIGQHLLILTNLRPAYHDIMILTNQCTLHWWNWLVNSRVLDQSKRLLSPGEENVFVMT